jgi:hypothetical protein
VSSLAALEAACSHLRKMIVNARLWRRIFMAKMEMEPGLQVCVCRLQCWGSGTFWCGPYRTFDLRIRIQLRIRLFFSDFNDAKKNFLYFFLITYPQAHYLECSKLNFLLKFCVKILFCKHYFSPLNIFMRKGKDPDPYF